MRIKNEGNSDNSEYNQLLEQLAQKEEFISEITSKNR